MTMRHFALTTGILYLVIGILGFFSGQVSAPPYDAPWMAVWTGYGYLFGMLPVNVLHNLMYLLIGGWALSASRSFSGSLDFSHRVMMIAGALTVMGLLPFLDTAFGLIPLFGYNVGVHAMTALIAAYFGFQAVSEVVPEKRVLPWAA